MIYIKFSHSRGLLFFSAKYSGCEGEDHFSEVARETELLIELSSQPTSWARRTGQGEGAHPR